MNLSTVDPPEYVRYESVKLKYCEPPSLANVRSFVGKKGLNRLTLGSPPNVREAAVELLSTNLWDCDVSRFVFVTADKGEYGGVNADVYSAVPFITLTFEM